MGNRVALAHEQYCVMKTIRIVGDLGFNNRFEKKNDRLRLAYY